MLKSFLKKHKRSIDKELDLFFQKKIEEQQHPFLKQNYSMLREFVLRPGKRIRPISCVVSHKALGGKIKNVEKYCLAPELFHASSLIHDDIMDEDDLRRGKKTVHKQFEEYYSKKLTRKKDSKKLFGTSMAIMQGNILYSLAFDSVLETDLDDKLKTRGLKLFSNAYKKTNEGQMLDVRMPYLKKFDETEYIQMALGKTANPIAASIIFGGILAGAKKIELFKLGKYANRVGLAFQIHDDVLDLTTNKGRGLGSDIKKGNKTLVILDAITKSDPIGKKRILKVLGNEKATKKQISEIIQIIKNCGSIENIQQKNRKLVAESIETLKKIKLDKKYLPFFEELSHYAIERTK